MKNFTLIAFTLLFSAVALAAPHQHASSPMSATPQLIAESAILAGLAPGALFPFIDSTPHHIAKAHIAITDATSSCDGQSAPSNIQVLVGVAGGTLVNVMTASTNTGIGSATQCVFHVTITAGSDGVPEAVTDIVVVNANPNAPLTGINTITASAAVR
jgi:hypothetical protein